MGFDLLIGSCIDPATGLASLADRSVDHVITDPPYEAEAHTLQRRVKPAGWRQAEYGDGRTVAPAPLDFNPITPEERRESARQFARVARGWIVVFCQVEAVAAWRDDLNAAGAKYRRTIPWVKPDAMPSLHGQWPGQSFESIVLASVKGAAPCPGGGGAVAYRHSKHTPDAPHPTTKPLRLMCDLVELVSLPGELICDPFAGGGTTGIAALQLGRRFIGWEVKPEYAEIARRRLAGDEAKPNPAQPSLFGAKP